MQGSADLRSTILLSCSLAVVIAIVVWNFRRKSSSSASKKTTTKECVQEGEEKTVNSINSVNSVNSVNSANSVNSHESVVAQKSNEEREERKGTSDIPELKWVKVGQVKDLYYYPLKSGRGKEIQECKFTEYGISVESSGLLTLRDRMFLVYNEETKRFQTGRQYPTMILVNLSAVDKYKVKLEAVGMPSVVFRVPSSSKNSSATSIECTMWFGETVKCIDCGPEVAEWLSRFLTGTNSGLRLGYALTDRRKLTKAPWDKIAEVYDTLRDEDFGLFSDITSYMLMTTQSLDDLNEKLDSPVPALQFRPNIVVSGQHPFEEDNWEWIKIGERAIIRNVKPCTRCKMIKIDPRTGIADADEPLKTLKSFRMLEDPKKVALEGNAPLMGIYCGLYVTGRVKVGDEVFVHVPEDSATITKDSQSTNHNEENSKPH